MMPRKRFLGLALVVFVITGATATGAAASTRLTLSEGDTALAAGDAFEIYGENNLSLTTSEGPVFECEDLFARTGLEVSVVTNSKAKDELAIDRTVGPDIGHCRSFTGNVDVAIQAFGGPVVARSNGIATAGEFAVGIWFEHIRYGEGSYEIECVYDRKHLKGTNSATATKQNLGLEFAAALKLDVAASGTDAKHVCPKTAEMELSLPSSEYVVPEYGPIEEQLS
jgi:hypothetical protein